MLFEKNSVEEPYEFTLENAPRIGELSNPAALDKKSIYLSDIQDNGVADVRLCSIAYDENNNEIERIYSSQYRYTVTNGVCSRTITPTEPTSADHVVNIGIYKNQTSLRKQFYINDHDKEHAILPLVSTNQTYQYDFIIPDSWFDNAPQGYSLAIVGGDGVIYMGPAFDKNDLDNFKIDSEISGINNSISEIQLRESVEHIALTERVNGGTKILNRIGGSRVAAQVGYYYDSELDKLYQYFIYIGSKPSGVDDLRFFVLYEFNNENDPYELTMENAPNVYEYDIGNKSHTAYKARQAASAASTKNPIDIRLCMITYDVNEVEINRTYSCQYRYTIANGTATRTRVNTEFQDANIIEDIGLVKNNNSGDLVDIIMGYLDYDYIFYPLVSTEQTYQFEYIVPDSMFENAPYGYSLSARNGAHTYFKGPGFLKAKEIVEVNQGIENAGKYLVVGDDGKVVPVAMTGIPFIPVL